MENRFQLLNRKECLLMVVDIQESLLTPCVNADQVKKNAAALIDLAQMLKVPLLFSEQNTERLGKTLPELIERAPGAKVYDKLEFGCFDNEPLGHAIRSTGRNTLILCGIHTHVCILHTGLQGLALGYRVHVVSDAVSSPKRSDREVGLRRLEGAGAVVSSTEMVVHELLNRAGTPEFKNALPLLKTL